MTTHKQTGSALFIILLGVALFAALSYAVTQAVRVTGSSDGTDFGTSEKNALYVADIQQFLESVKMRVYEMTNINSVSENTLDFKNDVYQIPAGTQITANINPSCTNDSCHVFSPYGPQGILPLVFFNGANKPEQTTATLPKNGHGQVKQIILSGVGTSAPELVFLIHGIKPQICNLYNAKQGVTSAYTDATTLTSIGENPAASAPAAFTGTFNTTNDFGSGATDFVDKKSFCAPAYSDGENNRLAIWHVLKVR